MTSEHVAGVPVRNAQMLDFARHYGLTIATCVPADPASKGGSENAVKIAKADLVPVKANLLPEYDSFAALEAACAAFFRGKVAKNRPSEYSMSEIGECAASYHSRWDAGSNQ